MTILIVFFFLYLLGMPILLRLLCHAQKKLIVDRAYEKAGRNANPKNMPELLWPKVKERLSFTFKDTRPFNLPKKEAAGPPNRIVVFCFWLVGLATFLIAPLAGIWSLLAVGLIAFITATSISYKTAGVVIMARRRVYTQMFEIANSKLGLSNEYAQNPQAVIKVTDWIDLVKPNKVEIQIPTTFAAEGEEGFMRQFNQKFGGQSAWVPDDDPETGTPGWDFEKDLLKLRAVPPLPRMAPWSEHYVLDPNIAWSFFPVALGVENGVELVNPKTGETENVLGFDLSGMQSKLAKKTGVKVGPAIVTSPMAFIGGGTGGGKSLSVNTLTAIFRPSKN